MRYLPLVAIALFTTLFVAVEEYLDLPVPTKQPSEQAVVSSVSYSEPVPLRASYSTFADLLNESDVDEVLRAEGSYTLFAPSDQAFAAMPAEELTDLRNNPVLLNQFVRYCVVPGEYSATELSELAAVSTLTGDLIFINRRADNPTLTLNGATVINEPDLASGRHTLHGVDRVLHPVSPGNTELVW